MHFENFALGSIQIDGTSREYDVVIDRGKVCKRKKKRSKQFRDAYGHTPLSGRRGIDGVHAIDADQQHVTSVAVVSPVVRMGGRKR